MVVEIFFSLPLRVPSEPSTIVSVTVAVPELPAEGILLSPNLIVGEVAPESAESN